MTRGRKSKSGLEHWQENCNTCKHFVKTRYLHDGVDCGFVGYKCCLTNSEVVPLKVDGCKKYECGNFTQVSINIESKKNTNE